MFGWTCLQCQLISLKIFRYNFKQNSLEKSAVPRSDIWIWQSILGAAYAHTQQWRSHGGAWEPLVRMWDQVWLILFMVCDVVPRPVNNCERRSVNGLTDQYPSRWYGLVCRGSFNRCLTRALTKVETGCCKTRFCRMCHIQEYPHLNGCNAEVLWGHNVVGDHGLEADTQ